MFERLRIDDSTLDRAPEVGPDAIDEPVHAYVPQELDAGPRVPAAQGRRRNRVPARSSLDEPADPPRGLRPEPEIEGEHVHPKNGPLQQHARPGMGAAAERRRVEPRPLSLDILARHRHRHEDRGDCKPPERAGLAPHGYVLREPMPARTDPPTKVAPASQNGIVIFSAVRMVPSLPSCPRRDHPAAIGASLALR